jgi:voltage-gated potassium channel
MPNERRRPGRYLILLASLLLLLAVRPLVAGQYLTGSWIEAGAGLLVLLFVALMRRRVFVIAAGLFVVGLASSLLLFITWNETAPSGRLLLTVCTATAAVAFLCFICGVILHEVLVSVPVTWNTVCGALCVYLLAGAVCAYLYLMIYLMDPGSFAGAYAVAAPIDSPAALDQHSVVFTYYSFATLATLGMGDIPPRSSLARTLSWIEAVMGQIYLAVLVARLIGLQKPPVEGSTDRGVRL